ncbi:MAG: phosphate ABC transporter substrate-binding protein [Calditrichaeota bacterium]|nr:phosphate ABC transporter substrate-binding protein [Calditrichota bacterium]
MIRIVLFWMLFSLTVVSCTQHIASNKTIIRLKGSDTMLILAQQLADAYMTINPEVSLQIEDGGTATGFTALIQGETDIAMASRLINPQEAQQMAKKYKSIGLSYLVAGDALSIYLNPANQIKTLTMGDLDLIFSGQIDDWLVFTDFPGKIVPVIRPVTSGTFLYFKQHVLKGKDYASYSREMPTTKAVTQLITRDKNAIGYGGFAYGDSVFRAPVNGVFPTPQNVRNDTYPLARYLYFYTIDVPDQQVRRFIDWVIGPAGQRIVKQVGYIPLWD